CATWPSLPPPEVAEFVAVGRAKSLVSPILSHLQVAGRLVEYCAHGAAVWHTVRSGAPSMETPSRAEERDQPQRVHVDVLLRHIACRQHGAPELPQRRQEAWLNE